MSNEFVSQHLSHRSGCGRLYIPILRCISENVVVTLDRSQNSWNNVRFIIKLQRVVLFCLADFIQNVLYCGAFFHLAVAYRILACRIWNSREELMRSSSLGRGVRDNNPSRLFKLVARQRAEYEAAYLDSMELSSKTGVVAMMLVGLVNVEMVSVLVHGNFEQFKFDVAHLVATRHLMVLAALLLQLSLASADIMYASRRYAASMANLEGRLREELGCLIIYGTADNDADPKHIQLLADSTLR